MKHIKLFENFVRTEPKKHTGGDVAAMSATLDTSRVLKPDYKPSDISDTFATGDVNLVYHPSAENVHPHGSPSYDYEVCKDPDCVLLHFFEGSNAPLLNGTAYAFMDKSLDPQEVKDHAEGSGGIDPYIALMVIEDLGTMEENPYTDEFLSHCRYLIFDWEKKDPSFKRRLESIPAEYLEGPRKPMKFKVNLKIEK